MTGLVFIATGLVLLLWAPLVGPRYRGERSAFLATLGTGGAPGPPTGKARDGAGKAAGPRPEGPRPGAPPLVSPRRYRRLQVGLALYAGLFTALPGLVAGQPGIIGPLVMAGLAGVALPAAGATILRQRHQAALGRAVGDLISHLRLQTAAGTALMPALASAPAVVRPPLRSELEHFLADAQVAPLPSALERLAQRCGHPRVESLVRHLLHQQSLGVPLEQVFWDEEQHYLALAREEARQRIRSATVTMALITFVLFMNGALLFATPLAIRAFAFLSE